jgi:pyroglutamyl-peptidase
VTRVLVTGFEPFAGSSTNPSRRLVEELAALPPAGLELATAVLPVSFARAAGELRTVVQAAEPDVVVCFGQADGRAGISVERFALNLDDAANVDNEGTSSASPVEREGPVAYRSTLPVDEIVAALRTAGIPATASRDAGGFLCNHVFYTLMGTLERERPETVGGLVHVPLLPEQALEKPVASMPLEVLVRAAAIVLAVAAGERPSQDARAS